jgi:hypothetical protein
VRIHEKDRLSGYSVFGFEMTRGVTMRANRMKLERGGGRVKQASLRMLLPAESQKAEAGWLNAATSLIEILTRLGATLRAFPST